MIVSDELTVISKYKSSRLDLTDEVAFDSHTNELLFDSTKVLQKVSDVLNDNESLTVEILSFSSNGFKKHQLDALTRAVNLHDYFVEKGIDDFRVTYSTHLDLKGPVFTSQYPKLELLFKKE